MKMLKLKIAQTVFATSPNSFFYTVPRLHLLRLLGGRKVGAVETWHAKRIDLKMEMTQGLEPTGWQ